MKPIKVYFPTALSEIDPCDDNIDVIVTLENGISYVLVVATPANIASRMKNANSDYWPAGVPFVFVSELTYENIINLVESFCEDNAYWLKYYHYAGEKREKWSEIYQTIFEDS